MSTGIAASTANKASGLVQRELHKAKAIVEEEAKNVISTSSEITRSGAYLYPLKGLMYFFQHPSFLTIVKPIFFRMIMLSSIVTLLMFFFTYLPQVALLAFVSGPLAFIAAVPAVLAESAVLIKLLSKNFVLHSIEAKVFDATLLERGHEDLVASGRSFKTSGNGVKVMGKRLIAPLNRFSTEGMVRYILTLPLNAVPAIGSVVFLYLNGETAGPGYHSRYFDLKGYNKAQRAEHISKHSAEYTAFGMVAVATGLIPFVGILFSLSNTVGAALFASDLEKANARGNVAIPAKQGIDFGRGDEL